MPACAHLTHAHTRIHMMTNRDPRMTQTAEAVFVGSSRQVKPASQSQRLTPRLYKQLPSASAPCNVPGARPPAPHSHMRRPPAPHHLSTASSAGPPTWKHSQYFLRQNDFLQLHPLRCRPDAPAAATTTGVCVSCPCNPGAWTTHHTRTAQLHDNATWKLRRNASPPSQATKHQPPACGIDKRTPRAHIRPGTLTVILGLKALGLRSMIASTALCRTASFSRLLKHCTAGAGPAGTTHARVGHASGRGFATRRILHKANPSPARRRPTPGAACAKAPTCMQLHISQYRLDAKHSQYLHAKRSCQVLKL